MSKENTSAGPYPLLMGRVLGDFHRGKRTTQVCVAKNLGLTNSDYSHIERRESVLNVNQRSAFATMVNVNGRELLLEVGGFEAKLKQRKNGLDSTGGATPVEFSLGQMLSRRIEK